MAFGREFWWLNSSLHIYKTNILSNELSSQTFKSNFKITSTARIFCASHHLLAAVFLAYLLLNTRVINIQTPNLITPIFQFPSIVLDRSLTSDSFYSSNPIIFYFFLGLTCLCLLTQTHCAAVPSLSTYTSTALFPLSVLSSSLIFDSGAFTIVIFLCALTFQACYLHFLVLFSFIKKY